jgi:hypothetical protein
MPQYFKGYEAEKKLCKHFQSYVCCQMKSYLKKTGQIPSYKFVLVTCELHVDSKRFWRWSVTLRIIRFSDLICVRYCKNKITQRFGHWKCFRPQVRGQTPTLFSPLERSNLSHWTINVSIQTNKLRGFSPQTNYTDRVTAACRWSLMPNFAERGCRVISATNPHGL